MRTMYDGIATLAAGIARSFPDAAMVAGYVNGAYAWSPTEWDLFPNAEHVTISVTASADEGDVLDVEAGDATPVQAYGWIHHRKQSGLWRPTVYCELAKVPAVREATGAYVLGADYDIWVADWTGSPHEVAGCAAVQYLSTNEYDASAVHDDGWPHRTPPQPVTMTPEVDVQFPILKQGATGQAVQNLQGLLVAHGLGYIIASATGTNVMQRSGVDGQFGPHTAEAVRKFQAEAGLPQTGTADAATWERALS
jgi:hypothetical protein